MGLTIFSTPILLHSMRHSMCDPKKLTPEQCTWKEKWFRNWYSADWAYALPVVYFVCATTIVFALVNLVFRKRHSLKHPHTSTALPGYYRLSAFLRYLDAHQFRFSNYYYSPQLGAILLIALFGLVATLLTLIPQPYWWPSPAFGGSPPIATRTGWLALGMLPFLLAFAAKWNLITLLTGVSHEKLQVFHRWTAWIMYILSLIHTFPFIVNNINQGIMETAWRTRPWYKTGIMCLLPQTWLVLMSLGPIRNRYYEFFKVMHYFCALLFVVFLFLHCNFRLSSADYFIATVIIYGLSFLARSYVAFLKNGFGLRAHIDSKASDMIKFTIPLPDAKRSIRWKPGQHFFLRAFGVGAHSFANHPFTVASLDTAGIDHYDQKERNMVFYIRLKKGTTLHLRNLINPASEHLSVMLDGPYGGLGGGTLKVYDRVLLIAGGSGGSFLIPILQDLAFGLKSGIVCKHVDVIWATKRTASISWYQSELQDALTIAPRGTIDIKIYVTEEHGSVKATTLESEGSESKSSDQHSIKKEDRIPEDVPIHYGRPDLPSIIGDLAAQRGTLGLTVCGPDSMTYDVRQAVAAAELQIIKGTSGAKEVFLHVENFGW